MKTKCIETMHLTITSCICSVMSTRSTYEYHAPIVYVEPIAELEAVHTPLY